MNPSTARRRETRGYVYSLQTYSHVCAAGISYIHISPLVAALCRYVCLCLRSDAAWFVIRRVCVSRRICVDSAAAAAASLTAIKPAFIRSHTCVRRQGSGHKLRRYVYMYVCIRYVYDNDDDVGDGSTDIITPASSSARAPRQPNPHNK